MRTFLLLLALLALGCPAPDAPRLPPDDDEPTPARGDGRAAEFFFCFWNAENLFDDQDDGRTKRGDTTYDPYYPTHPDALARKLENLARVLAGMNGGKGPDILCLAEVEVNSRAPKLLLDAYNERIDPSRRLTTILFENPKGGRDIGCAVLTRLPVDKGRTQLLGRKLRILEGHVVVNGYDLVIIASHWSSRLSDKDGASRSTYGDVIQGRYRAMAKTNPAVDFLVCGDFNDPPEEESVVSHLRAIDDPEKVRAGGDPPLLYNLMAPFAAKGEGTHYYRKLWLFDQICVSPGLLDDLGWSLVPGSATIVKEIADHNGRPNKFGSPSDKRALRLRGASDHFPVTCRLRVASSPDRRPDGPPRRP